MNKFENKIPCQSLGHHMHSSAAASGHVTGAQILHGRKDAFIWTCVGDLWIFMCSRKRKWFQAVSNNNGAINTTVYFFHECNYYNLIFFVKYLLFIYLFYFMLYFFVHEMYSTKQLESIFVNFNPCVKWTIWEIKKKNTKPVKIINRKIKLKPTHKYYS